MRSCTKLYREKYHSFDGNKLVIFSGIALYYGDTYIVALFQSLISPFSFLHTVSILPGGRESLSDEATCLFLRSFSIC